MLLRNGGMGLIKTITVGVGITTVGFCSRRKKLNSTLNAIRKSKNLKAKEQDWRLVHGNL
jgi:primosomal replication protein N